MNKVSRIIGIKIKTVRKQSNITQVGLAIMLKKKQKDISEWEKGVKEASVGSLIKIANALQVKISDLVPTEEEIESLTTHAHE